MNKLRYFFALLISLTLLLAGCRAGRQAVEPQPVPQGDPLEMLRESYVPWSYVEMPVRVELRSPKKFSVSGTAKMVAGESVLVSLRFFGMEMASLWLTADSVQVIVKPMSVYYKEDITTMTATAGITVADLQDLVMGRVFEVQSGAPFTADFFASFDAGGAAVLDSVTVTPAEHRGVTVDYGAPEVSPCGPVASTFGASTTVRGHDIDFSCRWDVDRAKWNTGKTLTAPHVPADMRRLTTDDLFKILKKL